MNRSILIGLCLTILLSLFSGCMPASTPPDSGAFQELYNRADLAKEFSQQLLSASLNRLGYASYAIEETRYGFLTKESPTYLVDFTCRSNGEVLHYGYEVAVDDQFSCTVLAEGPLAAHHLIS